MFRDKQSSNDMGTQGIGKGRPESDSVKGVYQSLRAATVSNASSKSINFSSEFVNSYVGLSGASSQQTQQQHFQGYGNSDGLPSHTSSSLHQHASSSSNSSSNAAAAARRVPLTIDTGAGGANITNDSVVAGRPYSAVATTSSQQTNVGSGNSVSLLPFSATNQHQPSLLGKQFLNGLLTTKNETQTRASAFDFRAEYYQAPHFRHNFEQLEGQQQQQQQQQQQHDTATALRSALTVHNNHDNLFNATGGSSHQRRHSNNAHSVATTAATATTTTTTTTSNSTLNSGSQTTTAANSKKIMSSLAGLRQSLQDENINPQQLGAHFAQVTAAAAAAKVSKSVQGPELHRQLHTEKSSAAQQQQQQQLQQQLQQQQQQQHQQQEQSELLIEKDQPLPNHEPTKCSFKRNGIVKAYAANTNQGLVRNYNEDRVSIILNIMKPVSRASEQWPKCSFFGVYDGHGGVQCADFLRDNLHQFVIRESSFPWNPKEALKNGFINAEKQYLEIAQNSNASAEGTNSTPSIDRSGSCAIVVLIVGDMCYVANVGDSRAVLSGECGMKTYTLSRDHKPTDELEQRRIVQAGGKIYQTQAQTISKGQGGKAGQQQILLGPLRVFPGRLSVSRTFGDVEAKLEKYGGNPNVIISEPEIKSFKITDDHDFIVLASDGVFDKLSSREVIQTVWEVSREEVAQNIHKHCGFGVEQILRRSLNMRTLDNITVVMICFNNFKRKIFGSKNKKKLPLEERRNIQQQLTATGNAKLSRTHSQIPSSATTTTTNTQPNSSEYTAAVSYTQKLRTLQSALESEEQQPQSDPHSHAKFLLMDDAAVRKSVNPPLANVSSSSSNALLLLRTSLQQSNENSRKKLSIGGSSSNATLIAGTRSNNPLPERMESGSQQLQSQASSNILRNSTNTCHDQISKLRLLDQKISEISSKVNHFQSYENRKMGTQLATTAKEQ